LKNYLPWWGKIALKVILSRLPIDYRAFARMGVFRHGRMEQQDYALGVVRAHMSKAGLTDLDGLVCMELGPGDAVSSALIAHALGAKRCYLVDVGAFASPDMDLYRAQAQSLRDAGYQVADVSSCTDVASLMAVIKAEYFTEGLTSLRGIATESVDFVWSHAVLEHIRFAEFDDTLAELHRLLAPSGIASHRVDLQDHLAGSLNNLRFRRSAWERDWFAESGFYTNRIRYDDMMERFQSARFEVDASDVNRWERLPLAIGRLDSEFAALPEETLKVSGFNAVLRPLGTT
jgi:SAM-dependent methyltransferase